MATYGLVARVAIEKQAFSFSSQKCVQEFQIWHHGQTWAVCSTLDSQPDLPDEHHAALFVVPFLPLGMATVLLNNLVDMLDIQARPRSPPPGSSAATIPSPLSGHDQSMAAAEEDNENEQEQAVLHQTAQPTCQPTSPHTAATFYGGQPTAQNYPIWLILSQQPGDNYGLLVIYQANVLNFHQLPTIDLQATQSILQGNKQPRIAHKKEKPQDHKARQPHTLAQAKQTETCAAVQLPAKAPTPEEKKHLARDNGCLTCRQTEHSHYDCPTFTSTPGPRQWPAPVEDTYPSLA